MTLGVETSQTLDRGIRLLRLVAGSGAGGLTVTELAAGLEVGRPVVYRLLATLAEHDLVRRFADGQVRLGLGIMQLAAATHPGIRQTALPLLRELADAAGATAHLTILDGEEALAVAVVEPSWTEFHVGYRVGSRHLVSRGAAGRAIMSGRSGDGSVVSTQGELQQGARGLAAPILGVPGLEASVGVVTLAELDENSVSGLVADAASSIAAALT